MTLSGKKKMETERKFALAITEIRGPSGIVSYNIQSQNIGIAEPAIFFLVQAWLEMTTVKFKNQMQANIDEHP